MTSGLLVSYIIEKPPSPNCYLSTHYRFPNLTVCPLSFIHLLYSKTGQSHTPPTMNLCLYLEKRCVKVIRSCLWCWSRVAAYILFLNGKENTSGSFTIVILFKGSIHRNAIYFLHYFLLIITHTLSLLSRYRSQFLRRILFWQAVLLFLLRLNMLNLLLEWIFVFIIVSQFISDDGGCFTWEKDAFHAYWISKWWRRYSVGLVKLTCLTFFRIGRSFYIVHFNNMLLNMMFTIKYQTALKSMTTFFCWVEKI